MPPSLSPHYKLKPHNYRTWSVRERLLHKQWKVPEQQCLTQYRGNCQWSAKAFCEPCVEKQKPKKWLRLSSANPGYANRKLGLAWSSLGFTWITFDSVVILILFVRSLLLSTVSVPLLAFSRAERLALFQFPTLALCASHSGLSPVKQLARRYPRADQTPLANDGLKASYSRAMLREGGLASPSSLPKLAFTRQVRPSCRERMRPSGSSGDDNSGSRTQPPAELGSASHFMLCQRYGAAAVKWRSNPLQRRNGPTILQKLCLKKKKKKNTTHRVWAQGEALPTDGK